MDWLFQSQSEAVAKATSPRVRAWHCLTYAAPFVPILYLMGLSGGIIACVAWLWLSHFIIDSYVPLFLWAKHIRKFPGLANQEPDDESLLPPAVEGMAEEQRQEAAFADLFHNPVSAIILITVDQIFHLICLWPIIGLALWK